MKIDVAAGLIEDTKTRMLKGTNGIFTGNSWEARHLDRDVGNLSVMPLFEKLEFFPNGSEIERNSIPDVSDGFLSGVPFADAAGEYRTVHSPSPIGILL